MERWIVPCSIKFYDVEKHFDTTTNIVFKAPPGIKEKDLVYLYLGAPRSAIGYLCEVIQAKVPNSVVLEHDYAIKKTRVGDPSAFERKQKVQYMLLRLIHSYPKGYLSYSLLKKHGLGQVQISARAGKELSKGLEIADKRMEEKGMLEYPSIKSAENE